MRAWLLSQALPYIIGAGVFLLSLVGVGLQQRRAGAQAVRDKQAAERLEARSEADRIDDAVAGMTDEEVKRRQSAWSKR